LGLKAADVKVPAFLPDTPEVRGDILDYYFAVQRFDRDSGDILRQLEAAGTLDKTLVVMTSDNGMPFPRAKTNLYDDGSRMPLAVRWPRRVKPGRTTDALVSLTDLAPTFLEAAGLTPGAEMTGRSLVPLLTEGVSDPTAGPSTGPAARPVEREAVYIERERHANVRKGDLSYPARALRTDKYLYVRNFRPDLWPAGDPKGWVAVGPYGDIDPGPSKDVVTGRRTDEKIAPFYALACDKRPAEELYDLAKDPHQLRNVAGQTEYADVQARLGGQLDGWMKRTGDPRADGGGEYDAFDKYPYYGAPAAQERWTVPETRPAAGPATRTQAKPTEP
jgi:arylsulfatase A-like enzyme